MVPNPDRPVKGTPAPSPANEQAPQEEPTAVCPLTRLSRHWRLAVGIALATLVVILVLVWLAGGFHAKVPSAVVTDTLRHVPAGTAILEARLYTLPRYEWAIGSVQAVHETALGSKILAKVVETNVTAGQVVKQNDILMKLDDADLKAKVEQAKAAVEVAQANFNQTKIDYDRVMNLAKEKVAAEQEINSATNGFLAAKARLTQVKYALDEAQTMLGYAAIHAPFDGTVIDKTVEAGDTVVPGQTLVKLYDQRRMQLVAAVRESLAAKLKPRQPLQAYIPAIQKICCGTIAQIVPQARAASRSFDVKVVGPCAPGVYVGMFGKLLIPVGDERVILIPEKAVASVGQLKLVETVEGDRIERHSIQIGRTFEDYIEVVSGLAAGTKICLPAGVKVEEKKEFLPTYLWHNLPVKAVCAPTPHSSQ